MSRGLAKLSPERRKPALILGVRKDIDEAREVCREHARKQAAVVT